MEILSSRILLRPADLARAWARSAGQFYRDELGAEHERLAAAGDSVLRRRRVSPGG